MPRQSRKSLQSSFFHVIVQGINKSYIFEREEDIKYYIKIMYKLKEEHFLKIISYCIMNNHSHILVKVDSLDELSKYMQRLNIKYAKYYNTKYNKVGYVFRDRFKSECILDKKHLYHCIKYIYDNPVKAGICNKAEEYPYSNYKKIDYVIDECNEYTFLDIEEDTEKICMDYINEFLTKNDIRINDLKNDKIKLKKLIKVLRDKYKLSFRKISEIIGVNRETVRKFWR